MLALLRQCKVQRINKWSTSGTQWQRLCTHFQECHSFNSLQPLRGPGAWRTEPFSLTTILRTAGTNSNSVSGCISQAHSLDLAGTGCWGLSAPVEAVQSGFWRDFSWDGGNNPDLGSPACFQSTVHQWDLEVWELSFLLPLFSHWKPWTVFSALLHKRMTRRQEAFGIL